jgi:hypothetical protein
MKGFNLIAAQRMSKPARISFSNEQNCPSRPGELSHPVSPCLHRK